MLKSICTMWINDSSCSSSTVSTLRSFSSIYQSVKCQKSIHHHSEHPIRRNSNKTHKKQTVLSTLWYNFMFFFFNLVVGSDRRGWPRIFSTCLCLLSLELRYSLLNCDTLLLVANLQLTSAANGNLRAFVLTIICITYLRGNVCKNGKVNLDL